MMKVLEALTKLVVGMGRLGDHLLSRKVSGIVVASLAFACGAGLVYALKRGPRPKQVAPAAAHGNCPLPAQDGATARPGTRMLWRRDVPPDAELQVVGSKVYAVTKTKDRILLGEIKGPRGER